MPPIILGPTGQYPKGKLNEDDSGELQIAVGIDGDTVIIMFGTYINWLGLGANDARALAAVLNDKANTLEKLIAATSKPEPEPEPNKGEEAS